MMNLVRLIVFLTLFGGLLLNAHCVAHEGPKTTNDWTKNSTLLQGYASVMPLLGYRNYNAGVEFTKHKERVHMGLRLGLSFGGYLEDAPTELTYLAAPHLAGVFYWGNRNWHPELTAGLVVFPGDEADVLYWPILNLGVRFDSPSQPIVFRAAFGTGGFGVGLGIRLY